MPINVTFDAPPTPPSSGDKTNFRLRYDAFLAYIQSLGTKLITFVTQINDLETNVNAKEASTVAASNIAVALTNYKGVFVQGTSSALVGESWAYGNFFYRCSVNTSNNPVTEPASWTPLSVGAQIHASTAKTTPVDADEFGIWDSVSSAFKKVTFLNLKATLKTYFDSLYIDINQLSSLSTTSNPLVVATVSALQSISSVTWTKVLFNLETADTTNSFDTSTGRFTPNKAGWYAVNCSLSYNNVAGANYCTIKKNGLEVFTNVQSFTAGQYTNVPVNGLVYLNGLSDYIEVYGYSTVANGFYPGTATFLQIFFVRGQ